MELKRKVIILIIILMIIIPLNTKASSVSVTLDCPTSVTANTEVTCTVSASPSGSNLAGIQFNYSFTNATYKSFTVGNGWSTYSNSANGVSLGINEVSGSVNVGTLKVGVGTSAATISLTNVQGTNNNYDTLNGSNVTKTINIKSNNNNLSSLSITGGTLNPSFNAGTTSYNVSTESGSVTVSGTTEDNNATIIEGLGNHNLNYGNNTINVTVKSETGQTKTYTIVVNRVDNRSENTNLKTLTVDNGSLSPSFNKDTTSYTVSTESASIKVSGTTEDGKSTINGVGTHNLNYGNNTINIEVTSEKGTKKTYTIVANRKDTRNSNNNLKSLSVDKGSLKFNKNTTSYDVSVEDTVTSIKVDAAVEDNKSTFVSGFGPRTVNLNYGSNKIEIKVKAENETVKVYTINVTRKDNRSSSTELKNITLSTGTINFDPKVESYDISVKNDVVKLYVEAVASDSKSQVTIDNKDLEEGLNVIKITVKAENGETREYTLNVTRLKVGEGLSDNNNIKKLEILNHSFKFDPDITKYNIEIENEEKLNLKVELEDANATYKIVGNDGLIDGSRVKIVVISESGLTKEYVLNITKTEVEEKNEKSNIVLYIIFLLVSIIILIITIIVVKKKNKNKDKIEVIE